MMLRRRSIDRVAKKIVDSRKSRDILQTFLKRNLMPK